MPAKLREYEWPDVMMLFFILAALSGVFLGAVAILVTATDFTSSSVVAVVSVGVGAVGTVSGGVFGYTIGARGATGATEQAKAAIEEAQAARQSVASATPLVRETQRIASRAMSGVEAPGAPQHRLVSVDDLNTLASAAAEAKLA